MDGFWIEPIHFSLNRSNTTIYCHAMQIKVIWHL